MIKLEWIESFSVGNGKIDGDHKDIIAIMQDVRSSVVENDHPRCSTLLQDLIIRAEEHFRDEEAFLKAVSYPDLKEHINYHQELLLKAKAMKAICEEAPVENKLNECFSAMAEFLIDDIIVGDLKFKSYIEENRNL